MKGEQDKWLEYLFGSKNWDVKSYMVESTKSLLLAACQTYCWFRHQPIHRHGFIFFQNMPVFLKRLPLKRICKVVVAGKVGHPNVSLKKKHELHISKRFIHERHWHRQRQPPFSATKLTSLLARWFNIKIGEIFFVFQDSYFKPKNRWLNFWRTPECEHIQSLQSILMKNINSQNSSFFGMKSVGKCCSTRLKSIASKK